MSRRIRTVGNDRPRRSPRCTDPRDSHRARRAAEQQTDCVDFDVEKEIRRILEGEEATATATAPLRQRLVDDSPLRGTCQVEFDIPPPVFAEANSAKGPLLAQILAATWGDWRNTPEQPSATFNRRTMAARLERARAIEGQRLGGLTFKQWGSFLGRLTSDTLQPSETHALAWRAPKDADDKALETALRISGIVAAQTDGEAWVQRIIAGLALAHEARSGDSPLPNTTSAAIVREIGLIDPEPQTDFVPPKTTRDGDLESLLFRYFKARLPRLATQMVIHHPMILKGDQFKGLAAQLQEIAVEQGRFLERYNVLTNMHQTGGIPGWLELLERYLGLNKEDYLGLSVPYSGSAVAVECLRLFGWETIEDHDSPNNAFEALVSNALGAGQDKNFDELKEASVVRALERMLAMHARNGKKILVIDDGGYVAKALRKHFPQHEHLFKIVEWTTRGVRGYETIPDPKFSFVSAAETKPKVEIEPPFIADACVPLVVQAIQEEIGIVRGRRVLLAGAGNIGIACGVALQDLGASVLVCDTDRQKATDKARDGGLAAVAALDDAISAVDILLLATGTNACPPEVLQKLPPTAIAISVSSNDIETRSPENFANGRWTNNLVRLTVKLTDTPPAVPPSKAWRPKDPFSQAHYDALVAAYEPLAKKFGLYLSIEARIIVAGSYPINHIRRLRLMSPAREELLFLNVTEALAHIDTIDDTEKHGIGPQREDRVIRIFSEVHPDEYAYALDAQNRRRKPHTS